MTPTEIILIILLLILILITGFIAYKLLKGGDDNNVITEKLDTIKDGINTQVTESLKTTRELSGQNQKIISEVTRELTEVKSQGQKMISLGDQINILEKALSKPKQRGVIGEYYLEKVLSDVLPPEIYQTQYEFKNGEKVDAIVKLDKKILPIDSKFSLENYRRYLEADAEHADMFVNALKMDLKKRIDETCKYIRPTENTMEFAFMFIPSESLYYDLLINKIGQDMSSKNLLEYAFNKRLL